MKGAVLALTVIGSASAFAYTHNDTAKTAQSDGTYDDSFNAYDYIAGKDEDGWLLTVGDAGAPTYTWSHQLNLNGGHNFRIRGNFAGTVPSRGAATSGLTNLKSDAGSGYLFAINSSVPDKIVTISDFEFTDWNGDGVVFMVGNGVCYRLTNLHVVETLAMTRWCWIGSIGYVGTPGVKGPFGLMDHLTVDGWGAPYFRQNHSSPDYAWPNNYTGLALGGWDNCFIEDSVWNRADDIIASPSFASDTDYSAKIVARNNDFNNTTVGLCHGRDSGGSPSDPLYGPLDAEIYHNDFHITRNMGVAPVLYRAGTGVVWGNTVSFSGDGAAVKGVDFWDLNCSLSHLDGNGNPVGPLDCSDGVTAYGDPQQVGFPQPVYVWGNTGGAGYSFHVPGFPSDSWAAGSYNIIAPNRDYFDSGSTDDVKPAGYVPAAHPHYLQTGAIPTPTPTPTPGSTPTLYLMLH